MHNNDRLVQWLEDIVRRQYAGKVALVCLYGSHINGTANPLSDVDCYFVPKTSEGLSLARTFILDGVGYDIFPMTWERLEAIARLETSQQPLVGDVQVLYADSPEDLMQLERVQQCLQRNLQDKAFRHKMAQQRFQRACSRLPSESNDLRESRLMAGGLLMDVAEWLAYQRGEYYHRGLKTQFSDLLRLEHLPETLKERYLAVLKGNTPSAIRQACMALLETVGCNRGSPQPLVWQETPQAGQQLASLYEEICSTFNKIYRCVQQNDPILAFLSVVCLQWELPWLDVLSAYHFSDLQPLEKQTRQAEEAVRRRITQTGGVLHEYDGFEAFLTAQR